MGAILVGVAINKLMVFPMAPLLDADASVGWLIAVGFAPFLLVGSILNMVVAASAYLGVRGKLRVRPHTLFVLFPLQHGAMSSFLN